MKMKIISLSVLTVSLSLIFTACKKDNKNTTDPSQELTSQSDDQSRVQAEEDNVATDANIALSNYSSISGRINGGATPSCDITVAVDSSSNTRTLTFTYKGTNCLGSRLRTGQVVVSIPSGIHWKDQGAAVTISFNNLKVTRIIDNKSITINGSETITNVSGGTFYDAKNGMTVIHTITSSGITITFDDNTQRSWQVSKKRVFSSTNGNLVITTTGTHTDGTNSKIAEWGTNRFGNPFTTSIQEPIVISEACNFRITSGALLHTTPAVSATAVFGLDNTGTATSCPGTGFYYAKISWTYNGNTHSILLPY
jgi:hypothetical protein